MKIGFTGTQNGMNSLQMQHCLKILSKLKEKGFTEFHHGDCIGADAQADSLAHQVTLDVIIHPPKNEKKRAFCPNAKEIKNKKEYLERNHDIVDETDILVATPKDVEQLRSGTWSTVRYARKLKRKIIVIYPDKIEIENN